MKLIRWIIPVSALALITLVFPIYTVCTDFCDFTGTSRGWTTWLFVIKTGHSYRESSLEKFIKRRFPSELEHRWRNLGRISHNVFGEPLLFACGKPSRLMDIAGGPLDVWLETASEAEIKEFYELLRRDDREEVRKRVEELASSVQF